MEIFLTIVQVLFSVALIAIVLMQSGKEAGLSGAIGGFHQVDRRRLAGSDSGSEPDLITTSKMIPSHFPGGDFAVSQGIITRMAVPV